MKRVKAWLEGLGWKEGKDHDATVTVVLHGTEQGEKTGEETDVGDTGSGSRSGAGTDGVVCMYVCMHVGIVFCMYGIDTG